jgi:Tol biopolymer transport system component
VESSIADVYVMPASGGPPRAVTHDGAGIIGLAWAPDNRTLIVSSRRSSSLQRLWRFPLDGSAPVRLTEAAEAASYPNVNPRDGSIAYASRFLDANIWGIDLTGKMPPRRLIASNLLDSCPHYSPDGRRIAFRSNRTGNDELWVADANGGAPARLTSFEGPITGNARWSPDGAWLALDSRPHGHADVFLVPSGGGSARSLIEGPFNDVLPSFSADGTSVFFASDRSGRWEVWNQRLRGGGARQITTHGGFAPQVSADGRRIYYSKRDAEGLYSMPAAGGEETRVIDALPPSLWGGWALAGSDIVYLRTTGSRSEAAQLLVLNTATGRTTSAGRLQFPPVPWDGALSVSPDGRWALVSEIERAGSEIHLRDAE